MRGAEMAGKGGRHKRPWPEQGRADGVQDELQAGERARRPALCAPLRPHPGPAIACALLFIVWSITCSAGLSAIHLIPHLSYVTCLAPIKGARKKGGMGGGCWHMGRPGAVMPGGMGYGREALEDPWLGLEQEEQEARGEAGERAYSQQGGGRQMQAEQQSNK